MGHGNGDGVGYLLFHITSIRVVVLDVIKGISLFVSNNKFIIVFFFICIGVLVIIQLINSQLLDISLVR